MEIAQSDGAEKTMEKIKTAISVPNYFEYVDSFSRISKNNGVETSSGLSPVLRSLNFDNKILNLNKSHLKFIRSQVQRIAFKQLSSSRISGQFSLKIIESLSLSVELVLYQRCKNEPRRYIREAKQICSILTANKFSIKEKLLSGFVSPENILNICLSPTQNVGNIFSI